MNRLAALTVLTVALVGCDELEPFMPTVTFEQMAVQDLTFEQAGVDFVFAVNNPNPVDIDLSSFSYALGLEGQQLLQGDNTEGFGLEAVGSSELRLPVELVFRDAWDTVQATRGQDYVDFGIDGHFGFETNTALGEVRLPYAEEGDFPALRTPKFAFQRLRVAKLDLFTQKADLELDLGVDNAHGSTLFFDAFDYELRLGGEQVGRGVIDTLGGVEGATEDTLVLPFTVDLLSVGSTVVTAIKDKKPLPVGLDATMDVDTPFGIVPLSIDQTGNVSVQ